jgi:integrase
VSSKEGTKQWGALRETHLALKHGKGGCRCKANPTEEEVTSEAQRSQPTSTYLLGWVNERIADGVPSAKQEKQRVEDHVVPVIGDIKMQDVRPKHARQLVKALRQAPSSRGGTLAPRTVRTIFFTVKQAFQDAVLDEILQSNPIAVRREDLPVIADKDPAWRQGAVFNVAETETLISSPLIPEHRRVGYGIEFMTGLRTGQVSALKWGDYEPHGEPLGRLVSSVAYNSHLKVVKSTKTKAVFEVPVHPTLAKMLASWKLTGWAKRMGRAPTQDDLIIPTINNTHRDVRKALEDFHEDLERLRLRKRRHYDSRRTFISLAMEAGASKDVLTAITHPRPKDAFDLYRTLAWLVRCEAVMKLKIELKEGTLVRLPRLAVAAGGGDVAETIRPGETSPGPGKQNPPEPFGSGGSGSGGV